MPAPSERSVMRTALPSAERLPAASPGWKLNATFATGKPTAGKARPSIRISAWSSSTSSIGRPSSWIAKLKPLPRLMLRERRVSTGPSVPLRCRSVTSTHCRTLPSGPTCGSALQVPLGKRTCLPATGLSTAAAETIEHAAAATSDATTRPNRPIHPGVLTNMAPRSHHDCAGKDLTRMAGQRFNGGRVRRA